MEFRENLFIAQLEALKDRPARDVAVQVQQAAEVCCEVWGHDNQPLYLSRPGAQTIAMPTVQHEHIQCRRCGKST